ncbi:MAG: tryptophan-rich sensory protein [Lachnospiraceae bacterium]|nr:tryptophan-rich sensory protein [Lachnospiraceae bacterium]MDD3616746.1 tryptophan-rich sensory protein [Lachnospiraceae bacterium]
MNKIDWKLLIGSIAVSLGLGTVVGLLTSGSMQQYGELYQPPLAPPGWLFPIVWTILYTLMGISAYLVLVSEESSSQKKSEALKKYALQLLVNLVWPFLFFQLRLYLLAFAWLLLLWYLILITILDFAKIEKTAAYLLIPYLVWVIFAGYLNLAIAIMS